MRRTLVVLVVGALAACASEARSVDLAANGPTTEPPTPDERFVDAVADDTTRSAQSMLDLAHEICDSAEAGDADEAVAAVTDTDYDRVDKDLIVEAAGRYICPDQRLALREASDTAETTTTSTSTTITRPPTTTAPPTTAPPTTAEDPEVVSARGTARDYLEYSGFCRPSLIDQLEYEGYSNAAAVAAVDSLDVDWLAETVRVAQSYVDYSDFSHAGLVDQLEYEGCEPAHAEQAATQVLGF